MPAESRPPLFWFLLLLAMVTAFAGFLRAFQANESLWLDELHTAWVVSDEFSEVAPRAALGNQGPLYFFLAWVSTQCFGASEWSLRLPSLIAGITLVPLVFFAVFRWTKSCLAALTAALFVALERDFVFFAQEARPYAMVQFVGLLQLMLFAKLLLAPAGPDSRKHRLIAHFGLSAMTAALFYLHYTAILIVVAEVAAYVVLRTLCRWQSNYKWWHVALDMTIAAVLCLPALAHVQEIWSRREIWQHMSGDWPTWDMMRNLVVFILLPSFLFASSWLARSVRAKTMAQPMLLVSVLWFVIPIAVAWLATVLGIAHLDHYRYVIVTAVAPMIFAACCIGAQQKRGVQICSAMVILAAVIGTNSLFREQTVVVLKEDSLLPEFRRDGRFIIDRNEHWQSAIRWINESRPEDELPVLLVSGLLEDQWLWETVDKSTYKYLQFPLRGAVNDLDLGEREILPLPTFRHPTDSLRPRLTVEQSHLLGESGGAWLVIRYGEPTFVHETVNDVLHALRQAGIQANAGAAGTFGLVYVVRIEAAVLRE